MQGPKKTNTDIEDDELQEALHAIRLGLEQAARKEGRPMRTVLQELAKRHGIALE